MRSHAHSIRFSPDEWGRFEAEAKRTDRPVGYVVRTLALAKLDDAQPQRALKAQAQAAIQRSRQPGIRNAGLQPKPGQVTPRFGGKL